MDESEFEEDINIGENDEILTRKEEDFLHENNEEYSKPEPIENFEYYALGGNDEEIAVDAIPSDERPIDRRAFTIDDDTSASENVVKRRTGKVQRNTEGPIMSTKRKRLDGKLDIPGEQKILKKKVVNKVKTRKVAAPAKVRKVRTVKKDD